MSAIIISCANQKGGVTKTTTCANLGIGLAKQGRKVLLVDFDPQGSLTISLGHTGNWNTATVQLGMAIAWSVNLSYEYAASQYGYTVHIDAKNGNSLGEQLLSDGAVVLYESYEHCR